MKLERLFEVKDSRLYSVGGAEVPVTPDMVKTVKWSEVETSPESYDEAFLANLRDELKKLEDEKKFVVIEPVVDKDDGFEPFTAAMCHTARRIKDCVSVIGFAVPENFVNNAVSYMEELSKKHLHYCFFSRTKFSKNVCVI